MSPSKLWSRRPELNRPQHTLYEPLSAPQNNPIDPTPIITGISPSVWASGATTQVIITGENFGTIAASLYFSPGNEISYSVTSYSDTQLGVSITVASGTPSEDVAVSVICNGYTGQANFNNGGGLTSAESGIAYGYVSDYKSPYEITIVGWINGSAPDIQNTITNGSTTVQLESDLNGGPVSCNSLISDWAFLAPVYLLTAQDRAYANAWLISNSANSPPPTTLSGVSYLINAPETFRLLNDFNEQSGTWMVGQTPNPCGGTPTSWDPNGQPSQYMGAAGDSPSGNFYALAEGRVGFFAQAIGDTLNCGAVISTLTTCTPWI
jgi:hypothetical protein